MAMFAQLRAGNLLLFKKKFGIITLLQKKNRMRAKSNNIFTVF